MATLSLFAGRMQVKPNVSICIVNWNTIDDLRLSLESIRNCGMNLETIVCDNASSDGSADMVKCDFPEVILIANANNVGFGKANNLCFKKCTKEYVLIANPDIILSKTALQNLIETFGHDIGIGAVGALLLDRDGVPQKNYYRKFPNLLQHLMFHTFLRNIFLHWSFFRYSLWEDNTETEEIIEVDQPPGACILMNRKLLNELGGFDERFELFYEDVDLCWRIKKAGFKIVMNPNAKLIHAGQASLNKELPSILKHLFFQSGSLYFKLHKPSWQAVMYKTIYIVDEIIKILIRSFCYPILSGKRNTLGNNIKYAIVFLMNIIKGKKASLP